MGIQLIIDIWTGKCSIYEIEDPSNDSLCIHDNGRCRFWNFSLSEEFNFNEIMPELESADYDALPYTFIDLCSFRGVTAQLTASGQ